MSRVIGITGARGFIGSALVNAGRQLGLEIRPIALPRDLTRLSTARLAEYLGSERLDAVINAAAVRYPKSVSDRFLNASGPMLLREALNGRTRLLHVSSMNVLNQDADDSYAETKTEGERGIAGLPEIAILRPSLVWDAAAIHGVSRRIHDTVKSIPVVVPIPRPGPTFRPIGVTDLANAIIEIAIEPDPPAVVNFTGASRVTLYELFATIARHCGKRTVSLPIELVVPGTLRRFLPRMVRASDPDVLVPPRGLPIGLDRRLPRATLLN